MTNASRGADRSPLGDYLRARRELVSPEQAGIRSSGTRRVPGLRREEVAMLAGISADYYLRMEQGRDRNPSPQVLEALARVLLLDDDGLAHLLGLVGATPTRHRRRPRRETVPLGVATLLPTLGVPAFVEGRFFDVLAANALATALSPRMAVGRNRLRDVFLDETERALHPDEEATTAGMVAGFRHSIGPASDDPRAIELVGELSLASARFRELWARHDVHHRESGVARIAHPLVGDLTLGREKLAIDDGVDGLVLVLYHAEAATASAERLALLGSLAVSPAG